MKHRSIVFIALIALVGLVAGPSGAQHGIDPPPPAVGNDLDLGVNQLKQFGIYDVFKARVKQENKDGKSIEELVAQDKADASALVSSLKMQCTVTDAILVAVDAGARTKTYEVACASGVGYFLVKSEGPVKPSGFTCFAADAARQADIAAHRPPSVGCGLPENAGTKATAASILTRAGKVCSVKGVLWRGQSATTDFLEAACEERNGFVVRAPLPGSLAPVRVDTCVESGRSGLPCKLTESDPAIIAAEDALKEHGVACDADKIRVIGHEAVKKRRVVEFLCPRQQPNGLVAFIPVEGSTAPFEALDCKAAAHRQAVCTLTK